jgi:hypothetical protein
MILVLTFVLLFIIPALFLWIGRIIEGVTSGRIAPSRRTSHVVNELTGEEWFMRPMLPMFGPREPSPAVNREPTDERLAPSSADGLAWYHRRLPPLFDSVRIMKWRRASS